MAKNKNKNKKMFLLLLNIYIFCISIYLFMPIQTLAKNYYKKVYKSYVLYQKQNEPVSQRLPRTYSF